MQVNMIPLVIKEISEERKHQLDDIAVYYDNDLSFDVDDFVG